MNVRLLRRIQKHILEEPRRFKMSGWVSIESKAVPEAFDLDVDGAPHWKFAKCGTAACIGGWAAILGTSKDAAEIALSDVGGLAEKLLDLTDVEAKRLFHVIYWPEQFSSKYVRALSPASRVKIAAARITHFIKTRGKE